MLVVKGNPHRASELAAGTTGARSVSHPDSS